MLLKGSSLIVYLILIAGLYFHASAQVTVGPEGRSGATFLGRVSVDSIDNFYIFGGQGAQLTTGQDVGDSGKLYNVWRWNLNSTWSMERDSAILNQAPVYGNKGEEAEENTPGARSGSVSWSDGVGNFYLFGGQLPDGSIMNDLWRFRTATNRWTWLSGSNTANALGVYGTQGQYSINNVPGTNVYLNDLWTFDLSSGQWMWVSGSDTGNQTGKYTVLSSVPGGRSYATGWFVSQSLWMFGGEGFTISTTLGLLSELWRFDIATSQWRQVAGSSNLNVPGKLIFNTPTTKEAGSRLGAVGWLSNDASALYLFGGYGFMEKNGTVAGLLNDVIRYRIASNEWTWISGSNMINMP